MAKNWAIAIGINYYYNLKQLKYAKVDAEAMQDWFKQEAGFDQVFLFTEGSEAIPAAPQPIPTQPTFANFYVFLETQFEQPLLNPEDNLWFFFAGHGKRDKDQDYLMFLDSSTVAVDRTAIPVDYVTQRLRRSGAGNVVLFIDACRDEDSRGGLGIGQQEHKGVITFYSCAANQKSWEIDELKHGSFTHTLLEGLRLQGGANCATVERLDQYLSYHVPQLNARYGQGEQNPYLKAEPPQKMYYILLDQVATLKDVEPLKFQASLAENEGNLALAEQLWVRILAVSRADLDAIKAIQRIAVKKNNANQYPIPEPVISTSQAATSSRGEEATTAESLPTPETQPQVFPFEVVTVDARGEVIKRNKGEAEYCTEDLGNDIALDMVYIPGKKFLMGSPKEEGYTSEKPQHEVTVPSFLMGKYQVTQAQWKAVAALPKVKRDLKPDPSRFKGDSLPVEKVSWHDAVEFCVRLSRFVEGRLSKHTGKQYRLPSEAQWEYACRAGTTTPFHFGKTITTEIANYRGTDWKLEETLYPGNYGEGPKGKYRETTTDVGSFPPNDFGLYDMHGNVWEWCADYWHENYKGAPTDQNPWLSSGDKSYRVLRGGSWVNYPVRCRSAGRVRDDPFYDTNWLGLRVVCVVAPRTLYS